MMQNFLKTVFFYFQATVKIFIDSIKLLSSGNLWKWVNWDKLSVVTNEKILTLCVMFHDTMAAVKVRTP